MWRRSKPDLYSAGIEVEQSGKTGALGNLYIDKSHCSMEKFQRYNFAICREPLTVVDMLTWYSFICRVIIGEAVAVPGTINPRQGQVRPRQASQILSLSLFSFDISPRKRCSEISCFLPCIGDGHYLNPK